MMKILKCKIIESKHHRINTGDKTEITTEKYVNHYTGNTHDENIYRPAEMKTHLKNFKIKDKDNTKRVSVWHYVLEEIGTEKLLSLKIDEEIQKENWDSIYVGVRATHNGKEEIVTFSLNELKNEDEKNINQEIKKSKAKSVYKRDKENLNFSYYLSYILTSVIYLLPLAVTVMNYRIVFKGWFEDEFRGYPVNMPIVKGLLIWFAVMPIYKLITMLMAGYFSFQMIWYSSIFWGLLTVALLLGGKIYFDIKHKNEIDELNDTKK